MIPDMQVAAYSCPSSHESKPFRASEFLRDPSLAAAALKVLELGSTVQYNLENVACLNGRTALACNSLYPSRPPGYQGMSHSHADQISGQLMQL